MQQVLGKGVTSIKGEKWRWRKVALLKAFHKSAMIHPKRWTIRCGLGRRKTAMSCTRYCSLGSRGCQVDVLITTAAIGIVHFFLFGKMLEFDTEEVRESVALLTECLGAKLFNPYHGPLCSLKHSTH